MSGFHIGRDKPNYLRALWAVGFQSDRMVDDRKVKAARRIPLVLEVGD